MGVHFQAGVPFVLVVDFVHFLDRVKEADDERRTERLTGLDWSAAELMDHADVTTLMAPRFVHDRRL